MPSSNKKKKIKVPLFFTGRPFCSEGTEPLKQLDYWRHLKKFLFLQWLLKYTWFKIMAKMTGLERFGVCIRTDAVLQTISCTLCVVLLEAV